MLTVPEVAGRLKVSPSTVYSLVERGLLECHRIGVGRGTIRITEEQLARYLEGARAEADSAPLPLRDIKPRRRGPS